MDLKVPNTEEGREFMRLLRKYACPGRRFRSRGRGPRAKHAVAAGMWRRGFDQALPLKYAEWFAVYFDHKNFERVKKSDMQEFRGVYYGLRNSVAPSQQATLDRLFDVKLPKRAIRFDSETERRTA